MSIACDLPAGAPCLVAETSLELCLGALIAGLAEECEHVLLVAFHTGLVERIDTQNIAGNGASLLEEVDQVAEAEFCRTALSSAVRKMTGILAAALSNE